MALAGQWRHGSIVEEVAVEGVSDQLGPGRALKLLLDVSSVRFNRADRDVKLRADLSVRVPEGEQPQNPHFALCQIVRWALRHGRERRERGSQARREVRVAGSDPPHRFDQFGLGGVLEDVAPRAGLQGGPGERRILLHRGEDAPRAGRALATCRIASSPVMSPGMLRSSTMTEGLY